MYVVLLALALVAGGWYWRGNGRQAPPEPERVNETLTANDKLIIVDNATPDDLSAALTGFSALYNEGAVVVKGRVIALNPSRFALVFPYDVTFERFCYLVNYLTYPEGIGWQAKVYAWTTIGPTDKWMPATEAAKKAIVFVPADDQEFDEVFVTTEDNRGFRLSFASESQAQLLSFPKEVFAAPPVEALILQQAEGTSFQ